MLVQFVGIPFAFLFGALADRIGAKPAIFLRWCVYTVISVARLLHDARPGSSSLLAFLVGTVQGGSQALSRSLFATHDPARHKSSEFFGFFAVFEKFAGIFGPLLFAAAVALTGSSRTRDPVGDRVLRRGRRAAGHRRHRGGTARGGALTRGREGRRQGLATHPFGVLRIGHSTCCAGIGGEPLRLNWS